jgi:predicted nucleic acid-binding Zn ribbon protein
MKCRKCKKEIPDEAQFCYHCGYEVIPPEEKPKPRLPVKAILAGLGALVVVFIIYLVLK